MIMYFFSKIKNQFKNSNYTNSVVIKINTGWIQAA